MRDKIKVQEMKKEMHSVVRKSCHPVPKNNENNKTSNANTMHWIQFNHFPWRFHTLRRTVAARVGHLK